MAADCVAAAGVAGDAFWSAASWGASSLGASSWAASSLAASSWAASSLAASSWAAYVLVAYVLAAYALAPVGGGGLLQLLLRPGHRQATAADSWLHASGAAVSSTRVPYGNTDAGWSQHP